MENSEVAIPFLVNGLEVIRKKRKICKNTFEENLDNIIATLQTEADEIEQITDEEVKFLVESILFFQDSKEKIEIKVKNLTDKVLVRLLITCLLFLK